MRVAGTLDDPKVTYLSRADVGAQLLRIPAGILFLPLDAIRLYTPAGPRPEGG